MGADNKGEGGLGGREGGGGGDREEPRGAEKG